MYLITTSDANKETSRDIFSLDFMSFDMKIMLYDVPEQNDSRLDILFLQKFNHQLRIINYPRYSRPPQSTPHTQPAVRYDRTMSGSDQVVENSKQEKSDIWVVMCINPETAFWRRQ